MLSLPIILTESTLTYIYQKINFKIRKSKNLRESIFHKEKFKRGLKKWREKIFLNIKELIERIGKYHFFREKF